MVAGVYQFAVVNPSLQNNQDAITSTQAQIQVTQAQQVRTTHRVHVLAAKLRHSLCALRADLQDRVTQTEAFLNHPENFPQFNDPNIIALTQSQVEGQKRTIAALGAIPCG